MGASPTVRKIISVKRVCGARCCAPTLLNDPT
jgi:hypothetical protein